MIFTKISAVLTIVVQLYALLLVVALVTNDQRVKSFIGRNFLLIGFLISLGATVGSLIYSEVIGYPPCPLCWWQRIFMYPQVALFGIALIKKDSNILPYILSLTIFGLVIAIYHNSLGLTTLSFLPCSTDGLCEREYVREFSYITIPMMSLSAYLSIFLTALVAKKALK